MKKILTMAAVLITATFSNAQSGGSFIQTPPGRIPSPRVYPGPPVGSQFQDYRTQACVVQGSLNDEFYISGLFEKSTSMKRIELPNGDQVYILDGIESVNMEPDSFFSSAIIIKSKMFNKRFYSFSPITSKESILPLIFLKRSSDASELFFRQGKIDFKFSIKESRFILPKIDNLRSL